MVDYFKALIESKDYPEVAYKQCLGILSLAKTHEKGRLNNACKRGLTFHRYGFKIIQNILTNNMDLESQNESDPNYTIDQHENIRGATYYQ